MNEIRLCSYQQSKQGRAVTVPQKSKSVWYANDRDVNLRDRVVGEQCRTIDRYLVAETCQPACNLIDMFLLTSRGIYEVSRNYGDFQLCHKEKPNGYPRLKPDCCFWLVILSYSHPANMYRPSSKQASLSEIAEVLLSVNRMT